MCYYPCENQESPGKTRTSWSPNQSHLPNGQEREMFTLQLPCSSCPRRCQFSHTCMFACVRLKAHFFKCPKNWHESSPWLEWNAGHLRRGTEAGTAVAGVKLGTGCVQGASQAGHEGCTKSLAPWAGRSSLSSDSLGPGIWWLLKLPCRLPGCPFMNLPLTRCWPLYSFPSFLHDFLFPTWKIFSNYISYLGTMLEI